MVESTGNSPIIESPERVREHAEESIRSHQAVGDNGVVNARTGGQQATAVHIRDGLLAAAAVSKEPKSWYFGVKPMDYETRRQKMLEIWRKHQQEN